MIADLIAEPLIDGLPPGLILIAGALLIPILPGVVRKIWMLALPVLALVQLLALPQGLSGVYTLYDVDLTTIRIDRLSLIFGYVFLLAAFLGTIYALHLRDRLQEMAALIYAGSTVGAVFAGDLITLFLFWEGTAIASVFLIWSRRTKAAYGAGQRYLLIQIGSGVLLLSGAMIHYGRTGSIAFESFDPDTLAGLLIFLAVGIKATFPLLHTWMLDAYPRATVTGTVFLSAFTTKLAIYALARGFAGTEMLVPIGCTMAIFPLFAAVIENDLRRVLAASQMVGLGFMVTGIGMGSDLAISGAVAYAMCSVIYMQLLFMATGAVLHRTGTTRASDLGGLSPHMPWTTAFGCVGAASISALPLFSGFVSKALILSAALAGGYHVTWLMLMLATAGLVLIAGLKVPYFAFFSRDAGLRPREAPANMVVAMALTAALCILIGVAPGRLYALLPFDVSYDAYKPDHIVTQLQLVAAVAAAFALLVRWRLYPVMSRSTTLDVDWIWRRPIASMAGAALRGILSAWAALGRSGLAASARIARGLYQQHGPTGTLARTRPSGSMALWMAMLLLIFLVFSFF